MSRETLRSVALVLGPLVLLAASFGACFERKTEEVPVGYSREALMNPYLALERLLTRMGWEVVSLDGLGDLDALPPSTGTLLIPTRRDSLSSQRSQSLLDWVERGGHLLVVTYSMWDEDDRRPDALLDPFGLQQHWEASPQADEEAGEAADGEDDGAAGRGAVEEAPAQPAQPDIDALATIFGGFSGVPSEWDVSTVSGSGHSEPLQLHFDPRFHWIDSEQRASWSAGGAAGTHLLGFEHGAGWITALTDDWLLRNDQIGDADHAQFMAHLAGLAGRDGPVWIVISTRWPGLWSQATQYAAPALTSFAVLLAAWLWRESRRFGPIEPPSPLERRRWIEHLDAAGRYDWRAGRGRALLRATRERVLRDLGRRRPRLAGLAAPQRNERIGEIAELRSAEVEGAFAGHPTHGEEFFTTIANLERIRRSL